MFIFSFNHGRRRTPPWLALPSIYGQHRPLLLEGGRQRCGAMQPCLKHRPFPHHCTASPRDRRPSRKPRPERQKKAASKPRQKQSDHVVMVNQRRQRPHPPPITIRRFTHQTQPHVKEMPSSEMGYKLSLIARDFKFARGHFTAQPQYSRDAKPLTLAMQRQACGKWRAIFVTLEDANGICSLNG